MCFRLRADGGDDADGLGGRAGDEEVGYQTGADSVAYAAVKSLGLSLYA